MNRSAFVVAVIAVVGIGAVIIWWRPDKPAMEATFSSRRSASPRAQPSFIDPKDILFSLPTLCDKLPPLAPPSGDIAPDAVRLHEDDWRQVEFVMASDRAVVEGELVQLRKFKIDNQVGVGWKNVFVRSSRPEALRAGRIPFAQVLKTTRGKPGKLYLDSSGALAEVRGGFALALDDTLTMYGFCDRDIVVSLNLHAAGVLPSRLPDAVADLCRGLSLLVVDWYRALVVEPGAPDQ